MVHLADGLQLLVGVNALGALGAFFDADFWHGESWLTRDGSTHTARVVGVRAKLSLARAGTLSTLSRQHGEHRTSVDGELGGVRKASIAQLN